MSDVKFTLPTCNYKKYARLPSILYKKLLDIISIYHVEYSVMLVASDKRVVCNSREEYVALKKIRYDYLRGIMDSNVDEDVIESFYPKPSRNQIILNDLKEVYSAYAEPDPDVKFEDLLSDPNDDGLLTRNIKIISFVDWAIRKKVPLPKEFINFNLPGDLAEIINKLYAIDDVNHRPSSNKATNEESSQTEDTKCENKSELMIKYALDVGAFCNENNSDDYIPTFDDVVAHLAGVYGKNVVPDYWVKEILSHASESMAKKDGRPKKILDEAIRTGFTMREWFDKNTNMTEIDCLNKFKKDLPKTPVILRPKAWKFLMDFKGGNIQ